MNKFTFQETIKQGIPLQLPFPKPYPQGGNPAPKRKDILFPKEKQLALRNALRYFREEWHAELAEDFAEELHIYGRIYMHRFRPAYEMYARSIDWYPAKCQEAASIMLMIQNNLDPMVAQHPNELITYGGNGAVFQNWAQYLLTMQYLSEMTQEQTLHLYSGHPMGLFPSSENAPRVVATNGMMIPNYSKPEHLEKYNALGVTQYGQMTAGSFMYIGPQGIVHGTTITIMNAFRKLLGKKETLVGKLFLTSGLGGMSGTQPKAGNIAGCTTVCAEVNPDAAMKRKSQGWVDELIDNLDELVSRVKKAKALKEKVSIAYIGNVVDVWERFYEEDIMVEVGSDQTSLHNPWSGGYYPVDVPFEEANRMIKEDSKAFQKCVQATLVRHVEAINKHTARGTYFFDYGNAFLLESSRAGADIIDSDGESFKYRSYVEDIMGPMCFDYGFGPFRWVCTSEDEKDLERTDQIAMDVLQELVKCTPEEIQQQMQDNIDWIKGARENKLVVGSQARILYANLEGRIKIAEAFNKAIKTGKIGPIVLGRDHHDVSGTDSPYRETSNIRDGSQFTADMAIHNVIGDSFRGATWVSIHNGGGVGWGEVINGGFGMLLDGSKTSDTRLKNMLFYDVTNGIARRNWARNPGAIATIQRIMKQNSKLTVTLPKLVDDKLLASVILTA